MSDPTRPRRAVAGAEGLPTARRPMDGDALLWIAQAGLFLALAATPVSSTLMNAGVAVAAIGAVLRWRRAEWRSPGRALSCMLILFVVVTAISAVLALDPWCGFASPAELGWGALQGVSISYWCGLRGLLDTARAVAVFFLAVDLLRSERMREAWLVVLIAVVGVIGGWGLLDYAQHFGEREYLLRAAPIGHHSNQTAAFLVIALAPVASAVALGGVVPAVRLLAGLTIVLAGVALVLTQSATAWLAAAVALLVFAVPVWRRPRGLALLAGLVLAGLAILAAGTHGLKFSRPNLIGSLRSRLYLWDVALDAIWSMPFFGVGPRNFGLLDPMRPAGEPITHAHNLYLHIGAEQGLIALGSLVAAFAIIAGRLGQTRRSIAGGLDRVCWYAMGAALTGLLVLGLGTTPYHSRTSLVFWAIVGLFYAQFHGRVEAGRR